MADVIYELVKKNLLKQKRNFSDIKVERYDSGGANYTSALYKIVVIEDGDETSLFAKVAAMGDAMRENINADWIFQTEQYVYTKLAKIYNDIQTCHNVPLQHRFVFPTFFCRGTDKGFETIITHDLGNHGYNSYDRFKTMDWEYASTSVQMLARFHALSFAYQTAHPEEFAVVTKDMESKLGSDAEIVKQFWSRMVENSLAAIDEEKRDRVRRILIEDNAMISHTKSVEKVVLVHGDYRLSNLLFRKQEDILNVVPVDYQMVHSGCAASDLVYFVSVGSDQQFRAKYFRKLVDYYYDELSVTLQRLSIDVVDVYPRKIFDMELQKTLPQMLVHGVLILPAVMVDADVAPKLEGDIEDFQITPKEEYKERFRDIVDDLIEWGAI